MNPVLTIRDDRIEFDPAPIRSTRYLATDAIESVRTESGGWLQSDKLVLEDDVGETTEIPTHAFDESDLQEARRRLEQFAEA